jgi:hypothetical protein
VNPGSIPGASTNVWGPWGPCPIRRELISFSRLRRGRRLHQCNKFEPPSSTSRLRASNLLLGLAQGVGERWGGATARDELDEVVDAGLGAVQLDLLEAQLLRDVGEQILGRAAARVARAQCSTGCLRIFGSEGERPRSRRGVLCGARAQCCSCFERRQPTRSSCARKTPGCAAAASPAELRYPCAPPLLLTRGGRQP